MSSSQLSQSSQRYQKKERESSNNVNVAEPTPGPSNIRPGKEARSQRKPSQGAPVHLKPIQSEQVQAKQHLLGGSQNRLVQPNFDNFDSPIVSATIQPMSFRPFLDQIFRFGPLPNEPMPRWPKFVKPDQCPPLPIAPIHNESYNLLEFVPKKTLPQMQKHRFLWERPIPIPIQLYVSLDANRFWPFLNGKFNQIYDRIRLERPMQGQPNRPFNPYRFGPILLENFEALHNQLCSLPISNEPISTEPMREEPNGSYVLRYRPSQKDPNQLEPLNWPFSFPHPSIIGHVIKSIQYTLKEDQKLQEIPNPYEESEICLKLIMPSIIRIDILKFKYGDQSNRLPVKILHKTMSGSRFDLPGVFNRKYDSTPLGSVIELYNKTSYKRAELELKRQIEQMCARKRHLTMYLYMDKKYPGNVRPDYRREGHLFMADDLTEYTRNVRFKGDFIAIKYPGSLLYEFIRFQDSQVFEALAILLKGLESLTILMDYSTEPFDLKPVQKLFDQMSFARLVSFSFIRSTAVKEIEKMDRMTELETVQKLYFLLENNVTAKKMPQLQELNIWFNHHYVCDMTFYQTHSYFQLQLDILIFPQLRRFTFVGHCAYWELMMGHLLAEATNLTHLTIDVLRAFSTTTYDKNISQPVGEPIEAIREYYTQLLSATLFETVTHLRLYRAHLLNNDNVPVLIDLFCNVTSLQIQNIRYPSPFDFNVAGLSEKITELRLHFFDFEGPGGNTERYPSIRKLTICSRKLLDTLKKLYHSLNGTSLYIQYIEAFFSQYPNLREVIIYSNTSVWIDLSFINLQLFDDIKQYCPKLEKVYICTNAHELGWIDYEIEDWSVLDRKIANFGQI